MMPSEFEATQQAAANMVKRTTELEVQAVAVSKMNPIMAASQIKALVLEACSAIKAQAVSQQRLTAEIAALKQNLSGLLPKGD